MTLKEFANTCGLEFIECDKSWGGKIGYITKDYPNLKICGFKSETSAINHWFNASFNEIAGKQIMKLIKASNK